MQDSEAAWWARENAALRERLLGLSEATLRLTESLDLDSVLREVAEGARRLTGARYGAAVAFGERRGTMISGIAPDALRRVHDRPHRSQLAEYLSAIRQPVRVTDLGDAVGLPGILDASALIDTFLAAPIRYQGEHIGNIYLGVKEGGTNFTLEDEETVVMFAAQAAMAITNARRYRDEYRARADLEYLIDRSPIGVVVVDAEMQHVVSLNYEARRIVGDMRGEGRRLANLLRLMTFRRMDGSEIAIDDLPTARALSDGETVRAEEIVIELATGHRVTTLVNATPIRSEDGEIASAVVTQQDLAPLEEVERQRAEFLGTVSHELRTPLTAIKGAAATALGTATPLGATEARQFFQIIGEQADRISGLVSDLLDLTRIEMGFLSVTTHPTDVSALVDDARSSFLRSGAQNSIEVEMAPDLPRIAADRERIVQVLYNLFSNASRYSPSSSTIRVTASVDDVYVVIAVVDEGRGVSSERLPYLFRKFSRLEDEDGGRESAGMGLGLGLAICKGIVEAHGGRIWADSAGADLGTRFTFTVPGVEEDANVRVPDGRSADARRRGRGRVLVLDDDPQALRYVRNTLSEAGYIPIVTTDPHEVEYLVQVETPDLVLMDLMLPGTNGVEVMERILGITDVPVIFLSGYGEEEHVTRAFGAGADDYIVKPFSPSELVARLDAAQRRRTAPGLTRERGPYRLRDLTIDYDARLVTIAGNPIRLTATEYKLLSYLAVNAGRVLTHGQLLRWVWGEDHSGDSRPVRSIVKKLRRKLGDDARSPKYIQTEPGVGYRMVES